jgi:type IV pilus assembly protein PilW
VSARQQVLAGPHGVRGVSLIEMMVTVVIGSFLLIGVLAIFGQTRTTYRTNDTVGRMQENARFAIMAIEPDLRLAGSWGLHNLAAQVAVPGGVNVTCPDGTDVSAAVLDPTVAVSARNDDYDDLVPCDAFDDNWLDGSDVLVVRHAGGLPVAAAAGTIQIQSDRDQSNVFDDGAQPMAEVCPVPAAPPANPQVRCTYNWVTNYYYVAGSSSLGATVPSLRRHSIVNGVLTDQELVPGVEDFQVQLGVDTTGDNGVDRYVEPDADLITVGAAGFDPDARILAVRIFAMFRAEQGEVGYEDGATYNYADVADYTPADNLRRSLVQKTIFLRNQRAI